MTDLVEDHEMTALMPPLWICVPTWMIEDGAIKDPRVGDHWSAALGIYELTGREPVEGIPARCLQEINGTLKLRRAFYSLDSDFGSVAILGNEDTTSPEFSAGRLDTEMTIRGVVIAEPYLWARAAVDVEPKGWGMWVVSDRVDHLGSSSALGWLEVRAQRVP